MKLDEMCGSSDSSSQIVLHESQLKSTMSGMGQSRSTIQQSFTDVIDLIAHSESVEVLESIQHLIELEADAVQTRLDIITHPMHQSSPTVAEWVN